MRLGVASVGSDRPFTASALLSMADSNLYQAKERGRNRMIGTEI